MLTYNSKTALNKFYLFSFLIKSEDSIVKYLVTKEDFAKKDF